MSFVVDHRVLVIPNFSAEDQEARINAVGQEGWELVSVVRVGTDTYAYFKRARR